MLQPYLLIGEIVRPQGIRGEVKVRHYTDDPARFEALTSVLLQEMDGGMVPMSIRGCKVRQNDVFLTFDGVSDRNGAEALRGVKLYIDRSNARKLDEDQVFIADILGASAYDRAGNAIGTLKEVLTPGGVDIFVFTTPRGMLMVPALKTVLLELDAAGGKIVLDEARLSEVAMFEDRDSHTVPRDI
ncbi:MAG: ribosome maturation factor RimM [Clostridia bacterium]|nr:ribosome maturation factor RimM [Clostridia bacterium]